MECQEGFVAVAQLFFICRYSPENYGLEPENHPFEKEHHLNQTSIF